MYALMSVLCLASSYWLVRWLRAPGRKRAVLASAAMLLAAIFCHYYAVFLLRAHAALVLLAAVEVWRGKKQEARSETQEARGRVLMLMWWCIAAGAVVAAVIPWLVFASWGFAYDDGFAFPLNDIPLRLSEWLAAFAGGRLLLPMPDGWALWLGAAAVMGSLSFWLSRRRGEWMTLAVLIVAPLLAATVAVRLFYPSGWSRMRSYRTIWTRWRP